MKNHRLLLLYSYFVRLMLFPLPDSPTTMRLRGWFYSLFMGSAGRNFQVASTAVLRGIEKIHCGEDVYIGPNAYVMARKGIFIESEVLIAMNVVVVDANHGKDMRSNSYRFNRGTEETILIGRGSWIAANSVVTAGANIAEGTLVPPCVVVRKIRDKK